MITAPSTMRPKSRAPRLIRLAEERLATVRASAEEMIKPSLFGQAIIILVYVPLLTRPSSCCFSAKCRSEFSAMITAPSTMRPKSRAP
jgi:hypothetical protein